MSSGGGEKVAVGSKRDVAVAGMHRWRLKRAVSLGKRAELSFLEVLPAIGMAVAVIIRSKPKVEHRGQSASEQQRRRGNVESIERRSAEAIKEESECRPAKSKYGINDQLTMSESAHQDAEAAAASVYLPRRCLTGDGRRPASACRSLIANNMNSRRSDCDRWRVPMPPALAAPMPLLFAAHCWPEMLSKATRWDEICWR